MGQVFDLITTLPPTSPPHPNPNPESAAIVNLAMYIVQYLLEAHGDLEKVMVA